MKKKFCFVLAQLDFLVGDIEGNADKIIKNALTARAEYHADLVIFPELALTGYPPEDLLLREGLYDRVQAALDYIAVTLKGIDIILGFPSKIEGTRYNSAGVVINGQLTATYHKTFLPNYSVFDEVRYFKQGKQPLVFNYQGLPIGIVICEDLWHKDSLSSSITNGAKLIISINASPFDSGKHETRINMLQHRIKEAKVPILYINCLGGQDELVFDGDSMLAETTGKVSQIGPFFEERLIPVQLEYDQDLDQVKMVEFAIAPTLNEEERIYKALVLGVRDYIEKNHFPTAIIGLSGGIDSALTLAIAVDAIGADRVEGILMPSRYTSQQSIDDALEQARTLNVKTSILSIEPIFATFLTVLAPEFDGFPEDTTEENLQARCRGSLLMAVSNKKRAIVLATGNKSEMSVGYCTLYGDMVGGFCVLKDIAKTLVYRLAKYRNQDQEIIPNSIIQREPTAELALNQKDQDTLPPYPLLDQIIELYIEQDISVQNIIDRGYAPDLVRKIIMMIDRNEYKRRQAAPGVRITKRAFGRDRRYPITSGYNRALLR